MPAVADQRKPVTIVLLPGMDGTGKLFAGFVAALGDAARPVVVAYPTDSQLDYRQLIDVARTFLPLGEPFVLLGESFSGPIAIALAAERPAGLFALVLCCSFAPNPENDRLVPASACRHLLALIPEMQVARFPTPHLLLQCAPFAAAQAVRKFAETNSR
jgi:pimeloyl-[acyl-carrier protein] methyl ester esterase